MTLATEVSDKVPNRLIDVTATLRTLVIKSAHSDLTQSELNSLYDQLQTCKTKLSEAIDIVGGQLQPTDLGEELGEASPSDGLSVASHPPN